MLRLRLLPFALFGLAPACSDDHPPAGEDESSGAGSTVTAPETGADTVVDTGVDETVGGSSESGATGTTGDPDMDAAAHALFDRWPGLWVGPVDSMTSVGDFPTMSMDARPADGHTLFSRVDLDGDNSLRFAFTIEDQGDGPVLVFRNGGEFLGILRDSRTVLMEADLEAQTWRFCSIGGGCEYIDAVFDFDGPDSLLLHVDVKGMFHFDWPAERVELRESDTPFPVDDTPQPGDAPFPPMPTLTMHLSWSEPLAAATDTWVILSKTNCFPSAQCNPSRFIHATAEAGATSVDLVLEQIHPDTYQANAILDRNGNLAGTFFPDGGDTVSFPDADVVVAAEGDSEHSLVLSVEI